MTKNFPQDNPPEYSTGKFLRKMRQTGDWGGGNYDYH